MIKNEEVSCTECIYCGSSENVFSFCKTQQTDEGDKKVCYCSCTSCADHIDKNLTPEVLAKPVICVVNKQMCLLFVPMHPLMRVHPKRSATVFVQTA